MARWVIEMKFAGDSTAPGRSWVVVDQYSGAVLSSLDSRTAPIGSKIPIVNREIHVGGLFETPTPILPFLVGFTVLLQTVTGYTMVAKTRRPAGEYHEFTSSAQNQPKVFVVTF